MRNAVAARCGENATHNNAQRQVNIRRPSRRHWTVLCMADEVYKSELMAVKSRFWPSATAL
jgi:hypothetical protein